MYFKCGGVVQWTGPGIVSGSNTTSIALIPGVFILFQLQELILALAQQQLLYLQIQQHLLFISTICAYCLCWIIPFLFLANPTGTNSISYLWDNAVTS